MERVPCTTPVVLQPPGQNCSPKLPRFSVTRPRTRLGPIKFRGRAPIRALAHLLTHYRGVRGGFLSFLTPKGTRTPQPLVRQALTTIGKESIVTKRVPFGELSWISSSWEIAVGFASNPFSLNTLAMICRSLPVDAGACRCGLCCASCATVCATVSAGKSTVASVSAAFAIPAGPRSSIIRPTRLTPRSCLFSDILPLRRRLRNS